MRSLAARERPNEVGRRPVGPVRLRAMRTLYIGNKNVSSWSMRAWLALKEKGVAFEERLVDLTDPNRGPTLSKLAWMHSGFTNIRTQMSFETTFHPTRKPAGPAALAEAEQLAKSWDESLSRFGGPWLCGELSLADLTFAPMVRRLRAYAFPLEKWPRVDAWVRALEERPSVREWISAAEKLPPYVG